MTMWHSCLLARERWEGGGGTPLDRDAYLSNTPAGINSSGWAWGHVEEDAESVSIRFDRKGLKQPAGQGIVILVWDPSSESDHAGVTAEVIAVIGDP